MVRLTEAASQTSSQESNRRDFAVSVLWSKSFSSPSEVAKGWALIMKFWDLRREVFINQKNWGLKTADGLEFDQYDNMGARGVIGAIYIVAHRDGEVLGGARLLRTDNFDGAKSSYMIRDACLGLLSGMPTELCESAPPVSDEIWELTRLVAKKEPGVGEAILAAANRFLFKISARRCLFLGPPAFMRMAKKMGFAPDPLGKIQGNKDGRFLAFGCDVIPPEDVTDEYGPSAARLHPGQSGHSVGEHGR
ncbi:hypothetical protein EQ718_14145 (plasmid) [Paracoccus versutus]|uniref:acyl-homoserine-lactone synthase n=1 Tax=Paracoccus versutus TaxID=34007 RepID=A0AAQ0KJV8_PARVE|nr:MULTISPECIES: acyl-homoserine-lactone synthase [Paracoccus]REG28218.1 acyl homoserine lactone synthase [Paracoccus versutus]WEJ80065.1 hypothetical protein EQ718_14145 [Paracoccus versutus]